MRRRDRRNLTYVVVTAGSPLVQIDADGHISAPANTAVGTYHVSGTVTSGGGDSGTWSFTLDVVKADQTISFTSTAPTAATVDGATYTPTASATSGLPVVITIAAASAGTCAIAAGEVSFTAVGTCTVTAHQAGDSNVNAATPATQDINVGKGDQTVSFSSTAPTDASVSGATYTPTATSTSGLPVTISVDPASNAVCIISGGVVSFQTVGDCTVVASQPGNANYNGASSVAQTFTVGKGTQSVSITSTPPTGVIVGGPTYRPTASASSGLPVTFSIDPDSKDMCVINNGVVSFIGGGQCTLVATQPGNADWTSATLSQIFSVAKLSQQVTFTSTGPADATVDQAGYRPTATATSDLLVTLSVDAISANVCTLADGTVTFTGAGTCQIDAAQPGNAQYLPAAAFHQSFTVYPALGISGTLPDGTVGVAYRALLTATGGVAPYSWSLAPGSSLPPGLTIDSAGVVAGTPTEAGTFTATVALNDPVLRTFTITIGPAVQPPVTPPVTPPAAPPMPPLASTGVPVGAMVGIATGLLIAGGLVLLALGRNRRGRRA